MFNRRNMKLGTVLVLMFALFLVGCGEADGDKSATSLGNNSMVASNSSAATNSGTGASGNASSASNQSDSDGVVTVLLKNFAFDPKEIRISAGTTVEFRNEDAIAHDVTQATVEEYMSGKFAFQSPQIMSGQSWSYTFDEPGVYTVLCTVGSHFMMGMVADIIVE